MPLTVLIVDDHAGFRSWARALLQAEGYEVIGEAEDGASAVSAVRDVRPDVVLLDIQLPDIDGFEVARRLLEDGRAPAIVLTSSRDASDYGGRINGSGALGFVPKAELSGPALDAILVRPR